MTTTISLVPKPTVEEETKTSILDMLNKVLHLATNGEISGLVMIVTRIDGTWTNMANSGGSASELIGKLAIAQHDLIVKTSLE